MFRILTCLATEHDWRLVLLAGAVCLLASLAAVCLFHRALATRGRARAGWIASAGAATGCGIWATHFIAMLAYGPGVPVGYDVGLTVLSLLFAVAVTGAGLAVATMVTRAGAGAGGAIVGAGIAVMHYTGMAALEVPGRITWLAGLVTASILVGMMFAAAALLVAARARTARATLLAALLLTLAIVSHHFTAMGAVDLAPDPTRAISALTFSESALAVTIAGVTLAVLGASILGAVMDRRLAEKNVLLDTALNNMGHGVMMFDADSRVILCNQRYIDLYRLPPGSITAGLSLREVIAQRTAAGTFDGDADSYCAKVLSAMQRGTSLKQVVMGPDRRTIEVVNQPLATGGWVATHQDITQERRREESFRFLFDSNPLPMWVWDHATLRFLAVNNAALALYGYTREVFLGLTIRDTKRTPDWGAVDAATRGDDSLLRKGLISQHARSDGSVFDIELYGRPMEYDGHRASLVAGIDVTERKRAEGELRRTRAFLDTIIENMPAMLTVKDATELRYVLVNRAAEQFFGMRSEEMIGKRPNEVFTEQATGYVEARDREVIESGELRIAAEQPFETRNGTRLISSKKMVVRGEDGRAQYVLSLAEDVTDQKRARDQIAYLERHDPLTGLPNRAAFNEKLAAMLAGAPDAERMFAILSVDLDRFKEVNDVFGNAAGDAVLCEVGRRLGVAANGAFLARLGGDEFALIVADGVQPSTAEAVAERLLQSMANEIAVGDQSLRVGLSVGVAVYPSDGRDTLLANANAALYRAKAAGRGTIRFFEAHMDEQLRERRALQHDLRAAIEQDELTLHYQPQARISGETLGFEALVRWHHPVRGMVSPGAFIPLAEESGLIIEMGEWILREACREAASWPKPLQVAVNLSPIQFRHGDLPSLVHAILLETGLAPQRLELEVTEGVLINDFARAVAILRRLKLLGVSIAMDDFGTGYSSLSYLQSFPFDKIKIDRTFIANLTENHYSATIVRAVIGLGRGLNLPVMAEGVETAEQLAFLARESCNEVQGYHIGRPAPIEFHAELVGRKTMPKLKIVAG